MAKAKRLSKTVAEGSGIVFEQDNENGIELFDRFLREWRRVRTE